VLVAIVARGQPEREIPPVLSLYTQLAITLSPLIFIRYDIFPALLSALGLYAMIRGRPMLAGALTGAGMAAKLYPVVFIPVFVVAYFVSRDRKSLFAFGFGLAAALVLIVPPFAWISGGKMWTALQFLQVRGLQIESVAAGIISLLKVLGVTQASSVHEYHAWHLETPLSAGALTVLPILLISAFVVASFCCAFRFWEEYHLKGRVSVQSMVAYSAIFLLILLVFSKVFSSQFLLWLLPFGVLLKRKQTLLLLATSLLTLIIYPLLYLSLIALEPLPVLMLNLRNILVILLLVWLLIEHRPSFRLPIQIPG
jgi:uncharacterized membrane protein